MYTCICTPLGTPPVAANVRHERTGLAFMCVCVGAKSGEDLACVSWVVRGISFSRSSARNPRRTPVDGGKG